MPAVLEAVNTVNARRRDFAWRREPSVSLTEWITAIATPCHGTYLASASPARCYGDSAGRQRAGPRPASRSSSLGKCRTSASPSGIDSRQAMAPTCTMPSFDITVMLSAGAVEDRTERVERVDPGAHEVERHRRPGDVGDHQVVDHRVLLGEPQPGVGAHREAERARRGELGPVLQRVGADRVVVLLRVPVALGAISSSRSSGSSMSVPSLAKQRGHLVGALRPLRVLAHARPARSPAARTPAARRARRGRRAARRRRRRAPRR